MEFYDFPYIGNVIIPTDCIVFFQRGRYTTKKNWLVIHISYIFKYPMSFTSRSLCLLLDIPMISIDFPYESHPEKSL